MDPLKNKRNRDRILKIWKPLAKKNYKKEKDRPLLQNQLHYTR